MIQHARVNELLKSAEFGMRLKFEPRRLEEDFDQRLEIILLGVLAQRKSKWRLAKLGRGHILRRSR